MFYKYIPIFFVFLSGLAVATQDIDKPEYVLSMLRVFLSNPIVAADVASLVENGCLWESESLWAGSGSINDKNQMEYGGGFTIYMKTETNQTRELRYFYSMVVEGEKNILTSVRYNDRQQVNPPKCQ